VDACTVSPSNVMEAIVVSATDLIGKFDSNQVRIRNSSLRRAALINIILHIISFVEDFTGTAGFGYNVRLEQYRDMR